MEKSPVTQTVEPQETLNIAVIQLTSNDSLQDNLKSMIDAVHRVCSQKEKGPTDLILFPENSLMFRIDRLHHDFHVQLDSVEYQYAIQQLSDLCVQNDIALHLGSFPAITAEGKKLNYSLWITSEGQTIPVYNKVHLFDVDVPGAPPVRESDSFSAGSNLSVGLFKGWKIGFSICYDIRFAELFSIYAHEQVDMILIPSAFLVPTGEAHWNILNRARAIESQCYVVSAAQGGEHRSHRSSNDSVAPRATYGHSIVVSPWGTVMDCLNGPRSVKGAPDILFTQLKFSNIAEVRKRIPMISHRKIGCGSFEINRLKLG